eukprot:6172494-Pleurochrysis_carterae.AAC.1
MESTSAHHPHRCSDWERTHANAAAPNSFRRTDSSMEQHWHLRTQKQLDSQLSRAAKLIGTKQKKFMQRK